MLPILPIHTKKKKKTTHRPRPQAKRRCVSKPGASGPAVAAAATNSSASPHVVNHSAEPTTAETTVENETNAPAKNSSVDAFAAAFAEPPAPSQPTDTPDMPPLPQVVVNPLHSNEANDEALVLAAEAAAALLDQVGETTIDTAAALLGVEVPTLHPPPSTEPGQDEAHTTPPDTSREQTLPSVVVPTLPPIGHENPLGQNVKTFISEPPKQPMSCVHSNFLQYYYNNESVGIQYALDLNVKKKTREDSQDKSEEKEEEKENGQDQDEIEEKRALVSFCSRYPKRKEEKVKEESVDASADDGDFQAKKSEGADNESTTLKNSTDNTQQTTTTIQEETPQVDFVDGELVVRNSTLFPNTNRVSTTAIDDEFGTAVEEDESTALGIVQAKYDSYTTKPRSKPNRWSVDETRAFYRALRQCGSDFSMMQMFLPGRSRSQLKSKFKLEQRRHPKLVDMALDPKKVVKLDLSVFGELEIPEEVTPISAVVGIPPSVTKGEEMRHGVTPEPTGAGAVDVSITETPAAEKGGNALQQAEPDMDRIFDHLFEDDATEEVAGQEGAKIRTDANEAAAGGDGTTQEPVEKQQGTQPALLLAPVVKPKVKKTKKFKAKPMAKKATAKK